MRTSAPRRRRRSLAGCAGAAAAARRHLPRLGRRPRGDAHRARLARARARRRRGSSSTRGSTRARDAPDRAARPDARAAPRGGAPCCSPTATPATSIPTRSREIAKKTPRVIVPPPLRRRRPRARLHRRDARSTGGTRPTVGAVRVTAVPASHPVRENGYVVASRSRARLRRRRHALVRRARRRRDRVPAPRRRLPADRRRALPRASGATMGPRDAAKAAALLKPRRVIPIGYGAAGGFPFVWYARRSGRRTSARRPTAEGSPPEQIVVLEPGESWHYFR